MKVKIHHEGNTILVVLFVVLSAINLLLYWLCRDCKAVYVTTIIISAIFYLLVVNFFRSPRRRFKGDPENVVVSSADGKVVALEEVYEPEYLKCKCIQLSVFMSVFNVHANWYPVDGEVLFATHHDGRFMGAYLPKSSVENERSTVVIKAKNGQLVLMRQVAGALARRIVTYAEPGDEASIADHMGFIKFGSRIDLYLPLDAEILVNIGEKTEGGVTPVARLTSSFNK